MSYTKTQWNNDTAPAINEDNLNKIEQGIYDNDSHIGDLSDLETTANTDLVSAINEVNEMLDGTQVAGDMVVDSIKSKNMLDSKALNYGTISQSDGQSISSSTTVVHHLSYIPVKPNTKYTISYNGSAQITIRLFKYGADKSYIGTETQGGSGVTYKTFTTGNNVYYLRLQFGQEFLNEIQLEEGEVATEYRPYQNLDNLLDNFNFFVTTSGTDLNDYKTPGIYAFESASVTPTNIPAGVNGWLVVMRIGETGVGIKQLFFRYGTVNSNDWQMWVRTLHGSNTWSNWFKLTTSYTSVGEVSYNTTILNAPYANSIVRNGNIVQINFVAQIKSASSSNWDIVTNLPPNVTSTERYVAYKGSSQYLPNASDTPMIIWPQVNNTSLRIGSVSSSDIGKYIYFNVTYISTESV